MTVELLRKLLALAALVVAVASFVGTGPTLVAVACILLAIVSLL